MHSQCPWLLPEPMGPRGQGGGVGGGAPPLSLHFNPLPRLPPPQFPLPPPPLFPPPYPTLCSSTEAAV